MRSNSVLCYGGWRIKSTLGLGSPRGSSSSRSETLQAILNMYTVQRAGRGAGVASSLFVGFPLAASGTLPVEDDGLESHFTE